MGVFETIAACGIVPVVVLENAEDAAPTAKALLAGGIAVMEITFRTTAARDSIAAVCRECPEILVGAGTVTTIEQCEAALEAGAKFIVSPGYSETIVAWCLARQIAVIPGCVTPTELMTAMAQGLRVVKFFPANLYGGLSGLRTLAAPFGTLQFIPTGGVDLHNLDEYLSASFVLAVGGSWLCSKQDITERKFEKLTALCAEASGTLRHCRKLGGYVI